MAAILFFILYYFISAAIAKLQDDIKTRDEAALEQQRQQDQLDDERARKEAEEDYDEDVSEHDRLNELVATLTREASRQLVRESETMFKLSEAKSNSAIL